MLKVGILSNSIVNYNSQPFSNDIRQLKTQNWLDLKNWEYDNFGTVSKQPAPKDKPNVATSGHSVWNLAWHPNSQPL